MSIKKDEISIMFSMVFLFLYGVNLRNRAVYFILAMIIPMLLIAKSQIRVKSGIILNAVAFILYFLLGNEQTMHAFVRFCIGTTLFMGVGYHYAYRSKDRIRTAINLTYALSFGFVLQQFLTLVINWNNASNRYLPDFWNGELVQPTNFNSRGIITIAMAYFVIKYEKRMVWKLLYFASLCEVLLASIMTASRTNLYFFIIFMAMDFVVDCFIIQKNTHREFKKALTAKRLAWICFSLIGVFIICSVFSNQIINWFMKSAIVERQASDVARFSLNNDPRWERWINTIKMFGQYPMGHPEAAHAHNLILDVGRVAGIIPMLFMLVAFIHQVVISVKVVISKNMLMLEEKVYTFCLMICLWAAFMIEPVLEGRPYIYIGYCLIFGIVYGMYDRRNDHGIELRE